MLRVLPRHRAESGATLKDRLDRSRVRAGWRFRHTSSIRQRQVRCWRGCSFSWLRWVSRAHVPLSARFPSAGEAIAPGGNARGASRLRCDVVAASAQNIESCAASILTTLPFIALSGYLSTATIRAQARAAIVVSSWLVLLYAWQRVLRLRKSTFILVAAANLLTIGLPVIWLVRIETSGTMPRIDEAHLVCMFSPTIAAVNAATGSSVFLFSLSRWEAVELH